MHSITITFIQYIYPSPFAGASLYLLIACKLSGKTEKPPCGAEPRIEPGPALQQADALWCSVAQFVIEYNLRGKEGAQCVLDITESEKSGAGSVSTKQY